MSEIVVNVTDPGSYAVSVDGATPTTAIVSNGGSVAVTVPDVTIGDVTGLTAELAGKAAAVHDHVMADITDLAFPVTSVNGQTGAVVIEAGGGGGGASLADTTPLPLGTAAAGTAATASRSDHVHEALAVSDVLGLSAELAAKLDDQSTVDGGDYVGVIIDPETPVITITSQPTSQTAINGAATFTVAATATPSGVLNYHWQRSDDGGAAWADISGATSPTLALTGLTQASNDLDQYRVVVSAIGATSVTSSAALLSVSSLLSQTEPAIVRSWFVATCSGTQYVKGVSFDTANHLYPTVSASEPTGASSVSYQWQISTNGAQSWSNLAGQQSSSLSLNAAILGNWLTHPVINTEPSAYSPPSLVNAESRFAPCVRCQILADGQESYSPVMPVLQSPYETTSGYTLDTGLPGCSQVEAVNIVGGGVTAVSSGNANTATTNLFDFPSVGGAAIFGEQAWDQFRSSTDSSLVRVVEKSTDGGITWNVIQSSLQVFQYPSTSGLLGGWFAITDLTAAGQGNLYRWRIGANYSNEVLVSDYLRLDYVVIGFTAPLLANQTAAGGQATFSATIPQHSSGVPVTARWQKSTNGGASWESVSGGSRQVSGTETIVSLDLNGLTSSDNQTQYRYVAETFGYGGKFLATSNAATLTVT